MCKPGKLKHVLFSHLPGDLEGQQNVLGGLRPCVLGQDLETMQIREVGGAVPLSHCLPGGGTTSEVAVPVDTARRWDGCVNRS